MESKLFENIKTTLKDAYKKCLRPIIVAYNYRFERMQRRRLRVHDFTIISADCIGGVISHRVGERFNSPTVNLWMSHDDCIKLILNLKHYVEIEPIFIGSRFQYPVAKIDDIVIYFNHYHSIDAAREKWNERKKRINYQKIYLVITNGDDLSFEQLEQIKEMKISNKAVFMSKMKGDYDFIKVIKPHKYRTDGFHCMDRTMMMGWSFEKKFDYVTWLNEGVDKDNL